MIIYMYDYICIASKWGIWDSQNQLRIPTLFRYAAIVFQFFIVHYSTPNKSTPQTQGRKNGCSRSRGKLDSFPQKSSQAITFTLPNKNSGAPLMFRFLLFFPINFWAHVGSACGLVQPQPVVGRFSGCPGWEMMP